ncbi:MAG: Chromosomal replication initiator protein DnaA [Candidatus Woesebacteria bacterium GW2011_GWA2_44_33]|uniref:Chromosomal replication initiator protein DnaA n=1 Tax=Candidatus Woesebacteria bacterium GW2011_GWA2_44_33 TaxID=1618564 RepID=A0A0G1L850_9BACT|nr:MAG: Chromosomal replication initiator protein DnaA [Candidatus Woesebacteria bacterium GW2011_GWA2_44_33]
MKQDEVWKSVKDDLRVGLSEITFSSFIEPAGLAQMEEIEGKQIAKIITNGSWHQKMIEEKVGEQIYAAFRRVTGKETSLQFVYKPKAAAAMPDPSSLGPLFSQAEEETKGYNRAVGEAKLRSDFTFEHFAVSSTNEMAYAAAQAVSRNPGKMYHLLFLYGGVGVGKTHLMQAVGHRILEKNPESKVIYCSGEQFTNEIIEAIQYHTTAEFRKKYRPTEALLIDDIQFIGGKDKVQEEFFHTFNAIHQEGGQIVMTSDKLPKEIGGLEDRLRSRFEGGLTIDIQKPSFELRAAIVLIKAKAWEMDLPMEVAQLVAANIEDTRELEGVLKRLMMEADSKKEAITAEAAQKVLNSIHAGGESGEKSVPRISPQSVLAAVSSVFSIKPAELKGKGRQKEVVAPRHLAMYILKMEADLPYVRIGEFFGGRDHTSIMHAVEKITNSLVGDARLRGSLTEVRKLL